MILSFLFLVFSLSQIYRSDQRNIVIAILSTIYLYTADARVLPFLLLEFHPLHLLNFEQSIFCAILAVLLFLKVIPLDILLDVSFITPLLFMYSPSYTYIFHYLAVGTYVLKRFGIPFHFVFEIFLKVAPIMDNFIFNNPFTTPIYIIPMFVQQMSSFLIPSAIDINSRISLFEISLTSTLVKPKNFSIFSVGFCLTNYFVSMALTKIGGGNNNKILFALSMGYSIFFIFLKDLSCVFDFFFISTIIMNILSYTGQTEHYKNYFLIWIMVLNQYTYKEALLSFPGLAKYYSSLFLKK